MSKFRVISWPFKKRRPKNRSKLSWMIYPWEGNALDDPEFQRWTSELEEHERLVHHQVALDMMLLERAPPYEFDIATGRDV